MSAIDVVSLTPFPAGTLVWEAQPGQLSLTVIVKATFTLAPGDASIAREQDPLCEERHWDDNGLASLRWPGDFAPSKRGVDVMLVGHAYAPQGEPAASLVARLGVGDWIKAVRVTGDRPWAGGNDSRDSRLQAGPPAPFQRLPLRYERAALSADNPIGMDTHALLAQAAPGAPALPNLEIADGGEGAPCFGPMAATWRARRRLLDEAATLWAYGVARDPRQGGPPPGAAPSRIDFAFFNAAPAEQQIDLLRPGTPIVLENLHPTHARLTTRLPAIRPQVFRVPPPDTPRARVEEIIVRADTLWIDTDRGVAVVVWRGLADVGRSADGIGRVVVAADPLGKKLRWEQVEKRLGERPASTQRLRADGAPLDEDTDVDPSPDPLALRHDTVKGQHVSEPEIAEITEVSEERLGLPLVPPSRPRPPLTSSELEDAPTNPLESGAPSPTSRRDDERTQALPALSPARSPVSRRAPVVLPSPRGAPPPVGAEPPSSRPNSARPIMAMGSPLGRPSLGSRGGAPDVPSPVPRPIPARGPGPVLRKDLTVQRCAEISAALAQKGADRAAVLRAHLLTEPAWAMIDQHWKKALEGEAATGGHALTELFDDAYVGAQERLQRRLEVAEYARLQVGVERGEVGGVLADLELTLGDLMRLQRVWGRRVAASPQLAASFARALEKARASGS